MSVRPSALNGMLSGLKEKISSTDSDLRLMALIDITKELNGMTAPAASSSTAPSRREASFSYAEEAVERELTSMVLRKLDDPIAEVKNMTVTCLGAMSRRARPVYLAKIVTDLLNGVSNPEGDNESTEVRRDICSLALKAVVMEMPTTGTTVASIVETIIGKVLSYVTQSNADSLIASDLLQLLTDVYQRFSAIVGSSQGMQSTSIAALVRILASSKLSVRKRAIPALSALVAANPALFDAALKNKVVTGLTAGGEEGRTWSGVLASLARGTSAPGVGTVIFEGQAVNAILKQTENLDETEAVEVALVTLEALVLRCPTEVRSYTSQLTDRALDLVSYDPNYVALDEDDEMNGDDEDEDGEDDDDFDDEEYADDEDDSWKIRRSAAKLLHALIGTRSDILADLYRSTAPVLISRFNEREDSVRVEVMAAYKVLLAQMLSARTAELAAGARNKRKRADEMDQDGGSGDSITAHLSASLPQTVRAILKQITSKSVATREECFVLLRQISEVLGGGLESYTDAICTAAIQALRSVDSMTTTSLAVASLAFLAVFFRTNASRSYIGHLEEIATALVRCIRDKPQRINLEAFTAASALAQALRPTGSASPLGNSISQAIQKLFAATTETLADTSVDADVRERALETLGNLLVHEGDALTGSFAVALPLISARLGIESTANTAVLVIGRIASSPNCRRGPEIDAWLLEVLPGVITALRRSRRSSSRTAEFACVESLLNRIGEHLPTETANNIIAELRPFVESPITLQVVSLILEKQPACRPAVSSDMLPSVLQVVKTASVHQQLADALAGFFRAYTSGEPGSAGTLVESLASNVERTGALPDATVGGTGVYSMTARCIGEVVGASQAGFTVTDALEPFVMTIKSSKTNESDVYLALLCIGEIGRHSDLGSAGDLLERVFNFFKNESEDVRSAAAFAAGNLAVGSPQVFLPALIKHLGVAHSEATRVLLLHALKEVILHSSSEQLEGLADSLWAPLFADDKAVPQAVSSATRGGAEAAAEELGDDGVRNVKAACIGKLTITAPNKFLPQLQTLLRSTPKNRALVAAAVRYTFIDTSSAYDELISPLIGEFLSLMRDENLVVRRLSVASLNAASQNKPHLIMDRLASLQPALYDETLVRPELKKEVMMGPFKIVQDDGLENRKAAYEAMYTLLNTCFSRIDLPTFFDRVMAALSDVNDVKVLGHMLLLRLAHLAPTSVIPRIDDTVQPFQEVMRDLEVKEDTIRQDLERKQEMQRSALRTAVPLYKMSSPAQAPAFHQFVAGLLSMDQWKSYQNYQA